MATSLKTTNYGFGKYAPDDVTSYLTDYNGTMDKIDTTIKSVQDIADEAKATSDTNLNNISGLSQGLVATNKNVENIGKTQTAQESEIQKNSNDITELEKNLPGIYQSLSFTASAGQQLNIGVNAFRKLGDGVQGFAGIYVEKHTNIPYSRAVPEYSSLYMFDIGRASGNPLELNAGKVYMTAVLGKNASTSEVSPTYMAICYDSTLNATCIGHVKGESTADTLTDSYLYTVF